jgi:hypothetical protein
MTHLVMDALLLFRSSGLYHVVSCYLLLHYLLIKASSAIRNLDSWRPYLNYLESTGQ